MKNAVKWKICRQLCALTRCTHVPKIDSHCLLIPYYRHHWFAAILISWLFTENTCFLSFSFCTMDHKWITLVLWLFSVTDQIFPEDPKWSLAICSELSHLGCWISRMQVKRHPLTTDFSTQINLQTKTKHVTCGILKAYASLIWLFTQRQALITPNDCHCTVLQVESGCNHWLQVNLLSRIVSKFITWHFESRKLLGHWSFCLFCFVYLSEGWHW